MHLGSTVGSTPRKSDARTGALTIMLPACLVLRGTDQASDSRPALLLLGTLSRLVTLVKSLLPPASSAWFGYCRTDGQPPGSHVTRLEAPQKPTGHSVAPAPAWPERGVERASPPAEAQPLSPRPPQRCQNATP